MARAIDGDALYQEFEAMAWYDNADRDLAEDMLLKMPTLTPPNEPLTLEQLRAQNGALLTAMEAINNAAVEYLERGPYDDGEQTAVLFAQAVNELSRVFVSAPPDRRSPEREV